MITFPPSLSQDNWLVNDPRVSWPVKEDTVDHPPHKFKVKIQGSECLIIDIDITVTITIKVATGKVLTQPINHTEHTRTIAVHFPERWLWTYQWRTDLYWTWWSQPPSPGTTSRLWIQGQDWSAKRGQTISLTVSRSHLFCWASAYCASATCRTTPNCRTLSTWLATGYFNHRCWWGHVRWRLNRPFKPRRYRWFWRIHRRCWLRWKLVFFLSTPWIHLSLSLAFSRSCRLSWYEWRIFRFSIGLSSPAPRPNSSRLHYWIERRWRLPTRGRWNLGRTIVRSEELSFPVKENPLLLHSVSGGTEELISTRSKVIEVWQKRSKVRTHPIRSDVTDSPISFCSSSRKLAKDRAPARENVQNLLDKVHHSISNPSGKKSSPLSSKPLFIVKRLTALFHTSSFSSIFIGASSERVKLWTRSCNGRNVVVIKLISNRFNQGDETRLTATEKERAEKSEWLSNRFNLSSTCRDKVNLHWAKSFWSSSFLSFETNSRRTSTSTSTSTSTICSRSYYPAGSERTESDLRATQCVRACYQTCLRSTRT